jgi:hypothetical protein
MEWLGRIDDPSGNWGVWGWVGGEATPAERLLRQQYNHRYSKPDTQVSSYIRLEVSSSRVSSLVDHVIVTGPGLPTAGLTMVKSPPGYPRAYFIYQGDPFHWEAFNTDRCHQIDQVVGGVHSVPNCGLDWNAISKGSDYTFTLFDAGNAMLETLTKKLGAKPESETTLFAKRSKYFPQFNQPTAYQFEIKNIYNDIDGPFLPGKIFPLSWTNASKQDFKPAWISFNTQDIDYLNGNAVVEDMQSYPLYGVKIAGALPTAQTFNINALRPAKWAWATIISIDSYGNQMTHEISPSNPY